MRIEYSPVAVRDLERVWAEVFEASASEETATKYVDDLMNQISAKQNFPKSGAPVHRILLRDVQVLYGILQGGDRSDAGQQSGLWKERLHAYHFP